MAETPASPSDAPSLVLLASSAAGPGAVTTCTAQGDGVHVVTRDANSAIVGSMVLHGDVRGAHCFTFGADGLAVVTSVAGTRFAGDTISDTPYRRPVVTMFILDSAVSGLCGVFKLATVELDTIGPIDALLDVVGLAHATSSISMYLSAVMGGDNVLIHVPLDGSGIGAAGLTIVPNFDTGAANLTSPRTMATALGTTRIHTLIVDAAGDKAVIVSRDLLPLTSSWPAAISPLLAFGSGGVFSPIAAIAGTDDVIGLVVIPNPSSLHTVISYGATATSVTTGPPLLIGGDAIEPVSIAIEPITASSGEALAWAAIRVIQVGTPEAVVVAKVTMTATTPVTSLMLHAMDEIDTIAFPTSYLPSAAWPAGQGTSRPSGLAASGGVVPILGVVAAWNGIIAFVRPTCLPNAAAGNGNQGSHLAEAQGSSSSPQIWSDLTSPTARGLYALIGGLLLLLAAAAAAIYAVRGRRRSALRPGLGRDEEASAMSATSAMAVMDGGSNDISLAGLQPGKSALDADPPAAVGMRTPLLTPIGSRATSRTVSRTNSRAPSPALPGISPMVITALMSGGGGGESSVQSSVLDSSSETAR